VSGDGFTVSGLFYSLSHKFVYTVSRRKPDTGNRKPPNPTAFLICPTLSLLLGQVGAERLELQTVVWTMSVCGSIALLLCLFDWRFGLLALLCVIAFVWGFRAYARLLHPSLPLSHIGRLPDSLGSVSVEGSLYREPEQRGSKTRWFLRLNRLHRADASTPAKGNVIVTLGRAYREWHYGDRIRLPLRLRVPKNRDGGFDYVAYLARREVYRTAYLHNDWKVQLVRREGARGWGWIERTRRHIRGFIYRYLSPPSAPLLEALVLGDRGGLSPELTKSFAAVGMAHVLSISGLHVGMLSVWVYFILRQLLSRSSYLLLRWPSVKVAALASLLPVLLYTALAGGRIPTVRAAIMIGVYQVAVLFDRDEETFSSLTLAALIVAFVWPGAVMEISFQLSFLAVLTIVWGLRVVRSTLPPRPHPVLQAGWFHRTRHGLFLSVLIPLLATLGTGPLIVYHFGYLSLSGVLVNPVLVPFVGFILVPLGLLTGLASLLWSRLAVWLAWTIEPLLSFLVLVVRDIASLPLSSVNLPRPAGWVLASIYLVFVGLGWFGIRYPVSAIRDTE